MAGKSKSLSSVIFLNHLLSRKRASELLVFLKEAKRLASEKCYDVEEVFGPNGRKK